jgi:hypothetical protein
MSGRQFDSTENAELRAKIDEAKRRLPLPDLMSRLGLGEHAKKSARCLWHDDQRPSFSVFKGKDGFWHYNCFVCDSCGGDEIAFLVKHFNISRRKAIRRYLDKAGFPSGRPPKSHEYHKSREYPEFRKSPECPESPCVSVSPVSEGQGLNGNREKTLKAFGVRNACTERNTARKRRWQLERDLKGLEKGIGRELSIDELMIPFDEWYRLSQPFLDPAKTRDDYLALFLAELTKVRVPTGEGDTLNKALEAVSKLSLSQLPLIPDYANAPESWRRIAALHRELSRESANGTHFLSYRDAAKACVGLSHQQAYDITGALVRAGVIEIVEKGKAGLNGGKAAEFRYLLPQNATGAEEDDGGMSFSIATGFGDFGS